MDLWTKKCKLVRVGTCGLYGLRGPEDLWTCGPVDCVDLWTCGLCGPVDSVDSVDSVDLLTLWTLWTP